MTPSKKIYITLTIWVMLALLLISLVISPLFKGIKNNKESLLAAKKDTVSLIADIDNLEIINKQYQEYSPNLEKINFLFVSSEIPVNFIRFLEKLAADSNVAILISSGKNQKIEKQQWVPLYFRISVEGSYLNFSRFLDKLENSNYLIEVQDMEVRTVVSEKGDQGISADFSIKVFTR
jgi:Tfp pilus assembly protein PilO